MKPRSINIFLLDGDPSGIRVAQISMSTIQAIAFRRNQLKRVRDTFPEIERPGVYILIGADENEPDRLLAYIGESEGVSGRLSYHNSNDKGRDSKTFWTDTVVLISKDENLTKSHARYVESCLIKAAGGNPRWSLPNTRMPSDDAGRLPLPDRAAMDEFVDQTKTLVGALGWDLFREMRSAPAETDHSSSTSIKSASDENPVFAFRGEGFPPKCKSVHLAILWSRLDQKPGYGRRARSRQGRTRCARHCSKKACCGRTVISWYSQATTAFPQLRRQQPLSSAPARTDAFSGNCLTVGHTRTGRQAKT